MLPQLMYIIKCNLYIKLSFMETIFKSDVQVYNIFIINVIENNLKNIMIRTIKEKKLITDLAYTKIKLICYYKLGLCDYYPNSLSSFSSSFFSFFLSLLLFSFFLVFFSLLIIKIAVKIGRQYNWNLLKTKIKFYIN